jgi:iron complex outermembrane receptor protein
MTQTTRRGCKKRGQKFIKTAGLLIPVALFGAGQNSYAGDAASDKTLQFNIPAQSLSSALTRFSADTRLQVLYEGNVADKLQAPGLNGAYTPAQALEKLLGGTGLKYRFSNDKTITLEASTSQNQSNALTLKTMTVVGKAEYDSTDPYNTDYTRPNASTATKTDTPIMETPFSVQVVPSQVIEDQQVVRVEKALTNVAGVIQRPGNGGGQDMSYIRGFANNAYYRDGFRLPTVIGGGGTTKRDTANLERVEVLKGPGSILFGRSEPGGVVNLVTKQPLDTPYYSMQQQFGSFDFYRTTVDATAPVTDDKSLLYRVNLAYENSGSFQDNVNGERVFVAPTLTWKISPKTNAGLELEYLHFNDPIDHGIPALGNRPAPVPRSFALNEPEFNRNEGDRTGVFLRLSHAFNDNWKVENRFGSEFLDWNVEGVTFNGAQANGNLVRNFYGLNDSSSQRYINTLNLTGKFSTGFLEHTLLMSYEHYQLDSDRKFGSSPAAYSAPAAFNVFRPTYMASGPRTNPARFIPQKLSQSWDGYSIQDQVELPFNLFALAGVRYDDAETQFDVNNGLFKLSKDDGVSPRGGLLWRPMQWLSLYGSYTENFGESNYTSNNLGANLGAQRGQQWEVGTKTEFWDGRFTASLAYFDLTKQNMPVPDPAHLDGLHFLTIGEAESRGIEFESTGEILPGLKLIGAYAFTPFAEVTKDVGANGGIGTQGKRLPMAPEHSGSLWTTYDFQNKELRGLKIGGGVVAAGQRQGDSANTYQLPGYATLNLMTSYGMKVGGARVTTQVNLDNLLDKSYFIGSNGATASFYGSPRAVMGSIRVEY